MNRGFTGGGGGQSKQATFAGTVQDAYAQATRAIGATSGEIVWQNPPQAAKFLLSRKNIWTTGGVALKYDGDLTVQQLAPGQVTARFALKLQWNSAIPLFVLQVLAVIVAAMINPYFMYFALILIIVSIAATAWNASSGVPDKALDDIIRNLQTGAPAPGFSPVYPNGYQAPPPQPVMQQPAPPTPAPQPAAAPSGDTAAIVEQIKQLAALRDAGALTPAEFEAKKAELLARI